MSAVLDKVEREMLGNREIDFGPGDTVLVSVRIREGEKERIQPYQGVVIQVRGHGRSKSFTVRKASGNIYVERVFPVNSPAVTEIKTIRRGKVRRARIFYLRGRSGKATRIEEKKTK